MPRGRIPDLLGPLDPPLDRD
ncbi:fragment of putative drug/metabolite exporter (part 1) [Ralstonia solanacearum K60]|nr:fragment of putative drug/metabolite exporter (part 1) [Ralstonia solanacearum K60]